MEERKMTTHTHKGECSQKVPRLKKDLQRSMRTYNYQESLQLIHPLN